MQNDTVLNKMMKELTLAKEKERSGQDFLQHIQHVKLLCELFLEESEGMKNKSVETSFSEQEMMMMLGKDKAVAREKKESSTIHHDGANGDSIFDF